MTMMMFLTILLVAAMVGSSSAFVVVKRPDVVVPPMKTTHLFAESSTLSTEESKLTPIHLLAGFLGSGKTTTLKHLLENKEDVKIGVVVNDVASVNIDAKLVSKDTGGIVELQNGCACCSLATEFVDSIETLMKAKDFDEIVVELSGVADPTAVKNTWRDAVQSGHAVASKATLKNVVTLVDAQTFGSDYLTWDVARDRPGWIEEQEDCSGNRKVTELLAEQVEAADVIVVNKMDLADEDQLTVASKVAASLNDKAVLIQTAMGKVSPGTILIDKSKEEETVCDEPDCTDTSHSHSHDHGSNEKSEDSHSHSHDHDHACTEPDCTDSSHSHDHSHASCDDPDCTDESHSHSHDHACDDPTCTDTSHSHSHDHATSTDSLGINNFVYKATRPFDAMKIQKLLLQWPVPVKDILDLETLEHHDDNNNNDNDESSSPFQGMLRSKGFCWFAPTAWDGLLADPWRHDTAMYWSHAGKHMGIQEAGRFWGSVDDDTMKGFFVDNPAEYQRIRSEDFVTEEFGDRRQELVFIGVDLDEQRITQALDDCLLSEEEMEEYREKLSKLKEEMAAAA